MIQKSERMERWVAWLVVLLFLLSLIPVLGIAVYDHPCADDYSYGLMAHRAWQDTGSVLSAVVAAGAKVAERYQNWQGTYSSIFLMALQPSVFADRFYAVTPYLMAGMLICSTLAFLKEIIMRLFGGSRAQYIIIGCGLLLVSIQLLLSPVEGLYWYNGAVHYVFMYSCMLFLLACCVRIQRTGGRLAWIAACLLALVVGGGNYITALTTLLAEGILIGVCLLYRIRIRRPLYMVVSCSAAGLLISAFAPGNSVRQSNFEQPSVLQAIWHSFVDGWQFIWQHSGVLYLLFLIFLLPFTVRLACRMKIVLRFPLLVPLASFCLVSAMFAPMEYSVGIAYVGRTGNVVQLVIWLLGVLNEIYLVCYLMQHLTKTRMTAWIGRGTAICSVGALVIAFVFVCATYRTVSYTSVTALLSWKSGELAEYDAQVEERLTVLEDKNTDEVLLAPLTTHPYLLYFDDITDNPRDWRNKGMARFYQKSSVCLKE